MKPPIGGWSVKVRVKGSEHFVQGPPNYIAKTILDLHKRNAIPMTETRVWNWLNSIWQARDPMRAITPTGSFYDVEAQELTPEVVFSEPSSYGPILWASLNEFGKKGKFDKDGWNAAIGNITKVLDPQRSKETGCSECFAEWTKIRLDSDPKEVDNEHDAAKWVWTQHNRVNRMLNKPEISFSQAIVQHDWAFVVNGSLNTPA